METENLEEFVDLEFCSALSDKLEKLSDSLVEGETLEKDFKKGLTEDDHMTSTHAVNSCPIEPENDDDIIETPLKQKIIKNRILSDSENDENESDRENADDIKESSNQNLNKNKNRILSDSENGKNESDQDEQEVPAMSDKKSSDDKIEEFGSQKELEKSLAECSQSDESKKEKSSSKKSGKRSSSSWVQCDTCEKWRCVDTVDDIHSLANGKWVCVMNDDDRRNKCELSQESIPESDEEVDESSYVTYKPGNLVLGKMAGYPWWPGIIEDDPDFESFFYLENKNDKIAASYHVTFFDKDVSRAWLTDYCVRPFTGKEDLKDLGTMSFSGKNYARGVSKAIEDAKKALGYSPEKRVDKYGFLKRFKNKRGSKKDSDKEIKKDEMSAENNSKTVKEKVSKSEKASRCNEKKATSSTNKALAKPSKPTARKIRDEKEENKKQKEGNNMLKKQVAVLQEELKKVKSEETDEDHSQNSSQGEERLSIKNEDSGEKRLTAKSEFKKSNKPKLTESNRADDKTDTKSTTTMQSTLEKPEQMKTSSSNEQTDSDTLKKQTPVANALESKVLTESELHADQMIKKYIGQDRVVALLDTPEEAEKKRLKAEMTEKLKKEKAAERTKKKEQKGLERQKVKDQKAEKKRLSLEKKNEKVKAKKFVSAQKDGSNKEVVQVKTKETKPKNVAEKTETESKAELADFEDAVKDMLAAKKVPANENIAGGEVVSEKQGTTDVDMVSDNPTEDETTGDKVKDEQQAITTDQRASEVPENEKVTKVISEDQKGSKSDTEAVEKTAKVPKVKADTKTSDGKKNKKSTDKPSKKQKAEKKTPKPSEKTISEEKPKKKKVPKLTKPTLPAIGGDVKKPATGDLTSSAGVIKPKFKAPKKKSSGFQAPTKATKQSSGEKRPLSEDNKEELLEPALKKKCLESEDNETMEVEEEPIKKQFIQELESNKENVANKNEVMETDEINIDSLLTKDVEKETSKDNEILQDSPEF